MPYSLKTLSDKFVRELIDLWDSRELQGEVCTVWLYTIPVAFILLEKNKPEWTIRGTWVTEWCRGKGIGKLLLQEVLKDFEKTNSDGHLWVNITQGAEGFYLKQGFRLPGYRTDTPEPMTVGLYSQDKNENQLLIDKFGKNFKFEEI